MDRQQRVKSIVAQVLGIQPALRAETLRNLCLDKELFTEVQSVLNQHLQDSGEAPTMDALHVPPASDDRFREPENPTVNLVSSSDKTSVSPPGESKDDSVCDFSAGTLVEHHADPVERYGASQLAPDTVIGNYLIIEKLGEGGFGEVYRARQTEPVRREVAVKILKKGMDSRQVLARFEAERQTLAVMNHSSIAKVFDAGTTLAGQSYFVMELVKGIPISRFCDVHELSIQNRVKLFIKVCDAIQHAHQKGVIHRDIKPSNILVTGDRETASPVVIDFGVSKATQQEMTDESVATQVHQIVGTPTYMSPEQAEMSSLDIDTRADVYSLGVVLYELLCGDLPLKWDHLKLGNPFEIVRIIQEQVPERPSQEFCSASQEEQEKRAKRRMETPRSLPRALKDELDWIAMKCLEKDRSNRYASVSGLAADASRYLKNEPVLAKRSTLGYSLQKFAAKYRGLVAAGIVAFAVMVLALVASFYLMEKFRKDRRDLLLLSDLKKLDELRFEFSDLLTTPFTERQDAISDWVTRAEDPLSRDRQHRATLARLQEVARSAGTEQELRLWQLNDQTKLVGNLTLFGGDAGLVAKARSLLQRTPSKEQLQSAWEFCRTDLAKQHVDWKITPQESLFPIKNSTTELWEFVDLTTGICPDPQATTPDKYCGIQYVLVPGGTFLMGSPEDEPGRNKSRESQHQVTVTPFLIAKYETTQGIWQRKMGTKFATLFEGEMLPTPASWFDCREFGGKLNADLPTEAQWEYACRAGTTTPYSSASGIESIGWHKGNSGSELHAVGSLKPNPFGLYDMHGNCHEWVLDRFEADFYRRPEASGLNPLNPARLLSHKEWLAQEQRINAIPDSKKQEEEFSNYFVTNRGGVYSGPARFCRSADRFFGKPVVNMTGISFRLVRNDVVEVKEMSSQQTA
ncbi:MAG: bifunctional serine/threonine-protein kinase/formylglycine-generating enzyme family protein, partial [Planctomycetota bacterium]